MTDSVDFKICTSITCKTDWCFKHKISRAQQFLQDCMCAQQRRRSACSSVLSNQPSQGTPCIGYKDFNRLYIVSNFSVNKNAEQWTLFQRFIFLHKICNRTSDRIHSLTRFKGSILLKNIHFLSKKGLINWYMVLIPS